MGWVFEKLEPGEIEKQRWVRLAVWLAVAVLAFSRFVHLGYGDLKDWDECLYSWRAKIICLRGEWLDQSDLAWNGFYSAAFPPLQVWVTALLFKLFGFTEFCARFWPALMGAVSIFAIFLMARRLGRDNWTGLFAALFLASVWYYTMYSRRAQFDVPFTACVVLSLYFYVGYLDRVRLVGRRRVELERGAWLWLMLSGAALGIGLMTKIALALMAPIVAGAVALYAWLRGRHSFRQLVAEQVVINLVALAICLPWHLAMTLSAKGGEFWRWYIGYHLLGRSTETLDAHSGPWYFYFVGLWDLLPAPVLALTLVALLWSLARVVASFRRTGEPEEPRGGGETDLGRPWSYADQRYMLALVWLGFQLILFSISQTKRDTYTIPMYPPIALLAALFLGERLRDRGRPFLLATTLFAMAFLCILSRMKSFGDRLEEALTDLGHAASYAGVFSELVMLIAGVAASVAALYLVLRRRPAVFRFIALSTIVVAATVFCLRQVRKVLDPQKGTRTFGWQQVRPYINSMDYDRLVFVGAYEHPAALYYLNGLQKDWHPSIKLVPMLEFDQARIARLAKEGVVRVVIMKSWVRDNWSDEQLARLRKHLELLADGDDLAIYNLKRP